MIQVHAKRGWLRLAPASASVRAITPAVEESSLFRLRGLRPGARVAIGTVAVRAGTDGTIVLDLRHEPGLRGHIGLIDLAIDGVDHGEIDVVPDKMSQPAYDALRADLQRTWRGLALDPGAANRLRQRPAPPAELYAQLRPLLDELLGVPRRELVQVTTVKHLHQVRRASELSGPFLMRARQGRPAITRLTAAMPSAPEQALVAATLRRLADYARAERDEPTLRRLAPALRHPMVVAAPPHWPGVTWGMRSEARYRRVLSLYRLLARPELDPTDGPGDLRLGVKALPRLYEYWVYLQVLLAAQRRYGPPIDRGFSALVRRQGARRILELPAGTTVVFPGDVLVAFEPTLLPDPGASWQSVQYVPHPHPARRQFMATPDVVVLHRPATRRGQEGAPERRPDSQPWIVVFDAKYVGRQLVERDAAAMHEKYARMVVDGQSAVRQVTTVHPHRDLTAQWAGYGHIGLEPGTAEPGRLTLPAPLDR